MAIEYSIEIIKKLQSAFQRAKLYRPMRVALYDPGTELSYEVQEVATANRSRAHLVVENFVGGGFAGQVYRVKVTGIDSDTVQPKNLTVGEIYAMKILIPPSGFSLLFRNLLYWLGFQGPFQLQVNPAAARAGALWQKFIRRGAGVRFGRVDAVVDIYATFVDHTLGSCGELSEWVPGRTWRLEVDERLDLLKRWRKDKPVDPGQLGSPEYRAKYDFMRQFVELLHDMGGYEFARQYEWSTCKSQPNVLKRLDARDDPAAGLTAVDFRAGLALLPFLPMSPGDFMLILKGLKRGSLVQFDRGSIRKLERFVADHRERFDDMQPMLIELKACEKIYRDSVPDVTHNFVRLFYSRRLWATMLDSAVAGWQVKNIVDEAGAQKLARSRFKTVSFALLGLLPFLGTFFQRLIYHFDWRKHYGSVLTSRDYFMRALQGKMAEKTIVWHRDLRVDAAAAPKVAGSFGPFIVHQGLSVLPVGLHRALTDWQYAKERLANLFLRPLRLYFNTDMREEWLRDMVTEGRNNQSLDDQDAEVILSQMNEPFIQKYLKSLAVHICTVPVTQIVSIMVAALYIALHPEMPRAQAWAVGIGIIALFQVVPISPGSLVRGLYVVYLVIRERNIKDYNIAVVLGFFKYIGYLAFPIQMAYRYPVLARFMARHWATESVHIVPVFGEQGALLEHWVFDLFYNWPLTIRRRISKRMALRSERDSRYWHIGAYALAAAAAFSVVELIYFSNTGQLPGLKDLWWLAIPVPVFCGVGVTLGCGGATLQKRFIGAVLCGFLAGLLATIVPLYIAQNGGIPMAGVVVGGLWNVFVFSIFAVIGAFTAELNIPDPEYR